MVRVWGDAVAIHKGHSPENGHFLGTLDGQYCVAVDDEGTSGGRRGFVGLRQLWGQVDEQLWGVAGRAVQIVAWDRTHRFCGRCGQPTEPAPDERARRCPGCGLAVHPRLAPAVIVLVEHPDGRVLLARNQNFPEAFYSCLAGFVEPGETLEETVRREVREEVGIEVRDLLYFGSQPWPFPHSLMIGFTAQFESGELRPDGQEIAEAAWFSSTELPRLPGEMSIARALIEAWRRTRP
jgi:NAD+ diphosphatase